MCGGHTDDWNMPNQPLLRVICLVFVSRMDFVPLRLDNIYPLSGRGYRTALCVFPGVLQASPDHFKHGAFLGFWGG